MSQISKINHNFGWFFIGIGMILFLLSFWSRSNLTLDAQSNSTLSTGELSMLGDIIFFGLTGLTSFISGIILLKSSKNRFKLTFINNFLCLSNSKGFSNNKNLLFFLDINEIIVFSKKSFIFY